MRSDHIRKSFLRFFEERGHTVVPSASLIPVDPSLLLTAAGMVPFKPYFLGLEQPPFKRATSVQKSVRTDDIEVVGTTTRHFTFFEMLGNFSFGDYFKEQAIPWAYQYVTEVLGLDPEVLWFTVYKTDDEAEQIWIDSVGVPPERVQRGDKDNFWQMGVPGPCGPCSEIFVDRGPGFGDGGGPIGGPMGSSEERYVEIWNLVFMQNLQDEPYHVVGDLPARNIDTGMGLERVALVLQDVPTAYHVDVVRPVLDAGAAYSGTSYGEDPGKDMSLRILADHGRALTFLIGDGVVPSNQGRGYVLRRLLRRAVRHAWGLGGEGLLTPRLVSATVEAMGDAYPELRSQEDFIVEMASREESRFRRTLQSGQNLLDAELGRLAPGQALAGETAFRLHDTFGFPVELTQEVAGERDVTVDLSGFEQAMAAQRRRARAAWKGGEPAGTEEAYRRLLNDVGSTGFVGYDVEESRGRLLALLQEGEPVDRANEGDEVEAFLDRTPFYAEQGGQVGDSGIIETASGRLAISDTRHALPELYSHRGKVVSGVVQAGQDANARIDVGRREGIRKSHTGTHILHWALREVVGEHVKQAGSLVEDGRLRFDFSHYAQLSEEELEEVERVANAKVIENAPVRAFETSRHHADELGALAFFGEKYGTMVRVVEAGDYSRELCGGTHCRTTGQVGPIVVLGEASVGANLRRIEALTGEVAFAYLAGLRAKLEEAGRLLRAPPEEVPARLGASLARSKELEAQLDAVVDRARAESAGSLADRAEPVGSARLVVAEEAGMDAPGLRALALQVRDRLARGLVVLGGRRDGKGMLVAVATPDLVEAGVSAGEILAPAARMLGGGGSRDPEVAQ
ncbi:MAG: alanine--tRNA ligase, partial [Actinomycetota bacterium]|nr:alanine--tRNA ligase [Actinomycetota bacterium]